MTGPDPDACHPDAFLSPVFPAGQDISGKMNLQAARPVFHPRIRPGHSRTGLPAGPAKETGMQEFIFSNDFYKSIELMVYTSGHEKCT